MKTLSMLFGMLLMVGLMISPASAVNYAIDVNGNGTGDAALAIEVGDSTTLDFYIEAYSCAPDNKLLVCRPTSVITRLQLQSALVHRTRQRSATAA